jgi:glycosyltransferase involved in cell wall biosynthesis
MRLKRVLIATAQVPFTRGGAELLAEGLRDALLAAGCQAEIVAVPFNPYPPERIPAQMLACRLLDLTESNGQAVDVVIGLKFPAYLVAHPAKVLWLLHQYRMAYDLWGEAYGDLIYAPNGAHVRSAIRQADHQCIPGARGVFTISGNVTRRLREHCGIASTPLYHPPRAAEQFYSEPAEDYLFFPSRIGPLKRQALVVEALAHTRQPVRVHFAGIPDEPAHFAELKLRARELRMADRVAWLGEVSEQEKRQLYARCLGVVYPPHDEDYGYVTLEAMLSAKPVLTCSDSGGPLEFVEPYRTGLVAEPTPQGLAAALDELWTSRAGAAAWGKAGLARYRQLGITWPKVVGRLLACA